VSVHHNGLASDDEVRGCRYVTVH